MQIFKKLLHQAAATDNHYMPTNKECTCLSSYCPCTLACSCHTGREFVFQQSGMPTSSQHPISGTVTAHSTQTITGSAVLNNTSNKATSILAQEQQSKHLSVGRLTEDQCQGNCYTLPIHPLKHSFQADTQIPQQTCQASYISTCHCSQCSPNQGQDPAQHQHACPFKMISRQPMAHERVDGLQTQNNKSLCNWILQSQ